MKTLNEIRESEISSIKKSQEIWKNDERGVDNYWVQQALNKYQNLLANFDEYIQRKVALNAINVVELVCKKGINSLRQSNNGFEIDKDDPMVKEFKINEININEPAVYQDIIQKLYEYYGYTDILPSEFDIDKLKEQRDMIDITSPTYLYDSAQLDREIRIAEMRRGEGLNYAFSFQTIQEVDEHFQKHLAEAQLDSAKKM